MRAILPMKVCPFCAEPIQDAAIVCRFCQRPYPSPVAAAADTAHRNRRALVVVLVVAGLAVAALLGLLLLYEFVLAPMFGLPGIAAL